MKDINVKNIKIHECEELKQANKLISITDKFNGAQDAEVYLLYDNNEWFICVPYMNTEDETIEIASTIVKYCAYCGEKL